MSTLPSADWRCGNTHNGQSCRYIYSGSPMQESPRRPSLNAPCGSENTFHSTLFSFQGAAPEPISGLQADKLPRGGEYKPNSVLQFCLEHFHCTASFGTITWLLAFQKGFPSIGLRCMHQQTAARVAHIVPRSLRPTHGRWRSKNTKIGASTKLAPTLALYYFEIFSEWFFA